MKKGFCTKICSDADLKGMVVFVCHDGQIIAEINYDKGIDNMEIEILSARDESSGCVFPLKDFLEVLEKAKAIAIQCAKEDDELRKRE